MLNALQSVVIVEHQTLSHRNGAERNPDDIARAVERIKIHRVLCDVGPHTVVHILSLLEYLA